jgi:hypothetical protein
VSIRNSDISPNMLRDLTKDQRLLADFMSDLSEQAYYAGWMKDLEYALWEAVIGVRRDYGRLEVSETHRTRLRELSDTCGGWIVFDDDTEETWLPRAEWENRFSARSTAGNKFD